MEKTASASWAPPAWFVNVNKSVFGEKTTQFVASLPETVMQLSMRWGLTIGSPYADILQNYVAQAVCRDGTEAVFKISADKKMIRRQIDTLIRFNGDGAVKLLAADPECGALLMERANPGHRLSSSFDDETSVLIDTFRRLWHAEDQSRSTAIPTLSFLAQSWLPGEIAGMRHALLAAGLGEQVLVVDAAEQALGDLLPCSTEEILLHGDLHAGHVLSAGQGRWLSIDPLGIFGERAFDAAALFRDDSASLKLEGNTEKALSRRMHRLVHELGLDWERLRGWGLVQAAFARNWHFKVGSSSSDWSATTKFLTRAAHLFLGICGSFLALHQFGAVIVI